MSSHPQRPVALRETCEHSHYWWGIGGRDPFDVWICDKCGDGYDMNGPIETALICSIGTEPDGFPRVHRFWCVP